MCTTNRTRFRICPGPLPATRQVLSILIIASAVSISGYTRAEESEPEMPEAVMTPPKLVHYVQAEYPKEAFDAGITADVTAEIDIDESGKVTDVQITGGASSAFDAAAEAAMRAFVFEPATVDGVPIPARVTYKYRFFIEEKKAEPAEPAAEASPPAEAEAPCTLDGRVLSMHEMPVEGVLLILSKTDPDGKTEGFASFGGNVPGFGGRCRLQAV